MHPKFWGSRRAREVDLAAQRSREALTVLLEGEMNGVQVAVRPVADVNDGEVAGDLVAPVAGAADVQPGVEGIWEATGVAVDAGKQLLSGRCPKGCVPEIAGSRWAGEHADPIRSEAAAELEPVVRCGKRVRAAIRDRLVRVARHRPGPACCKQRSRTCIRDGGARQQRYGTHKNKQTLRHDMTPR